jgi:hypothetical protein
MLSHNFLMQSGCRCVSTSAIGHRKNANDVHVLDLRLSGSSRGSWGSQLRIFLRNLDLGMLEFARLVWTLQLRNMHDDYRKLFFA